MINVKHLDEIIKNRNKYTLRIKPKNKNLENMISNLILQLVLPNGMYPFFSLEALFVKS